MRTNSHLVRWVVETQTFKKMTEVIGFSNVFVGDQRCSIAYATVVFQQSVCYFVYMRECKCRCTICRLYTHTHDFLKISLTAGFQAVSAVEF